MAAGSGGARGWAERAVQWDPARNGIKYAVHGLARARGALLERRGKVPPIANIYTAGSPKAASQWMKALFDHPLVRARTGLLTLPQLDYQKKPERPFPAGTFVPGLYFSHQEYLRMTHRHPYRLVYMFRDPREAVVSGYHSAIGTHRYTNPEVEQLREQIRGMSQEDGILAIIEDGAQRLRDMASWVGVEDPNVAFFRIEDVQEDSRKEIVRMLEHCEVELPDAELDRLVADVSRESMQAKDLANRAPGSESHYRVHRESYADVFTPAHHAAIEAVVPGLVAQLGYPT